MPNTALFLTSYFALWMLILFHTLILLEVVRRVARGHVPSGEIDPIGQTDLLRTGTQAPNFEAPELPSRQRVRSESWQGQSTMLVFMAPECPTCRETAHELIELRRQANAHVVVLCRGEVSACKQFADMYLPDVQVLLDEAGTIAQDFRIKRTPTAVHLDEKGRILRYGFPRSVARLGLDEWLGLKQYADSPEDAKQIEVSVP